MDGTAAERDADGDGVVDRTAGILDLPPVAARRGAIGGRNGDGQMQPLAVVEGVAACAGVDDGSPAAANRSDPAWQWGSSTAGAENTHLHVVAIAGVEEAEVQRFARVGRRNFAQIKRGVAVGDEIDAHV